MRSACDVFIIILILLNFRLIGSSRIEACIKAVVWQAVALGALAFFTTLNPGFWTLATVGLTIVIKAGVLPALLRRAMRESSASRELRPLVGYTESILIGACMLSLSFLATRSLKVPLDQDLPLLVPATLFTILTGLFLIVARKKAITQVVGFITMENGIYLFGVAFAVREPWMVQTGVLLDVFAAVFVMGIMIYRIQQEFDHINTDQLSDLKD
jgi:hydrogenase-4 component E